MVERSSTNTDRICEGPDVLCEEIKLIRLAQGMLKLDPDRAEEFVLASANDALAQGNASRADMWNRVRKFVVELRT